MKKILLALLLFLLVLPLPAQVTYGVRAGAGYSSLLQRRDGMLKSGGRFGYNLAGVADIRLYHRVSLRPEIVFAEQGGNFYTGLETGEATQYFCHYYSFQLPVNVLYTFSYEGVKFGVGGGPVLEVPLWGKIKHDGHNHDLRFGTEPDDNLKAINMGINVGINIEYNKFFFAINALCGVINFSPLAKQGEPSLYQNDVTFSLGYMFRR